MTDEQRAALKEIRRLLAEMHEHWQKTTDDGHCKSEEGAICIGYPNWFACEGRESYQNAAADSISIYSYLFGPSRNHYFNSFDTALESVRGWHGSAIAATGKV